MLEQVCGRFFDYFDKLPFMIAKGGKKIYAQVDSRYELSLLELLVVAMQVKGGMEFGVPRGARLLLVRLERSGGNLGLIDSTSRISTRE
jgi:hypothetical protein